MAGKGKFTSASDVRSLYVPAKNSHKGQNGKLLIVAGSAAYHGSAVLAAKSAARFVDLLYFCSSDGNNELIKKLRLKTACVIVVGRRDMPKYLSLVDCVLVGPGMGRGKDTKRIVRAILAKKIRCVLDADALRVISPSDLHENCIITPHVIEFRDLFGMEMNEKNVRIAAKKYKCMIIAKGRVDVITDAAHVKFNQTGNAGMTKGGTGDTLAGLVAALFCKSDAFSAACAAAYLNGLAGDLLYLRYKTAYSAEDVAEALPAAYGKSLE